MAATNPGFEVIQGGTETETKAPSAVDRDVAFAMLQVALKGLGQRALVAAMDLFTLITCTGAWWLWYLTPDPNTFQIVHNSIFALFVLAANWIVRGRK